MNDPEGRALEKGRLHRLRVLTECSPNRIQRRPLRMELPSPFGLEVLQRQRTQPHATILQVLRDRMRCSPQRSATR